MIQIQKTNSLLTKNPNGLERISIITGISSNMMKIIIQSSMIRMAIASISMKMGFIINMMKMDTR